MPITIVYPGSGEPFGPGFLFRAETDFIGPLPSDSQWDIYLTAPSGEEVMAHWTQPADFTVIARVFFNGDETATVPVPGKPAWVTGEGAQLMAVLSTPSTSFEEIETVEVILDREAGQAAELANFIASHPPATGQGLSAQQAESLQIVQATVTAGSPFGIIDAASGLLGALLGDPPLGIGSLSSPPYDLTGDGVIPDDQPALYLWGVYWTADVPSGMGRKHGQSLEYQQRLVQFRTVHIVDGLELVTEILDANYHGSLWKFQMQKALRVEYSVTPGVTIHARWWMWP